MTASAWRHGGRIVAARPLTFAVYLAHYLAFYRPCRWRAA